MIYDLNVDPKANDRMINSVFKTQIYYILFNDNRKTGILLTKSM